MLRSSSNGQPAEQAFFQAPNEARPFGPSTADRMRAYRQGANDLAARAASAALANSGVDPAAVTHLVTVSCSGFAAPGFDIALFDRLPLPRQTSRTHVGFMGCHGALNGLRVAKAYVEADPTACVLLVAVELCSLHFQYDWTPQRIVANSLFADGAAAAVLQNASPSDARVWSVRDNWSEVVPDSLDAMSWTIGDHGFEMTLSPEVPELIRTHLRSRMEGWLDRHGLNLAGVATWAIHPGGPRILDACAEALGLQPDALRASRGVLESYGNMSSPTLLFVLDTLRDRSSAGPCVALGFGPGLAIEAALLGS